MIFKHLHTNTRKIYKNFLAPKLFFFTHQTSQYNESAIFKWYQFQCEASFYQQNLVITFYRMFMRLSGKQNKKVIKKDCCCLDMEKNMENTSCSSCFEANHVPRTGYPYGYITKPRQIPLNCYYFVVSFFLALHKRRVSA